MFSAGAKLLSKAKDGLNEVEKRAREELGGKGQVIQTHAAGH